MHICGQKQLRRGYLGASPSAETKAGVYGTQFAIMSVCGMEPNI